MPLWKPSRCEPSVVFSHWGETSRVYPDGDITHRRAKIQHLGLSLITLPAPRSALRYPTGALHQGLSVFCTGVLLQPGDPENTRAKLYHRAPDVLLLSLLPSEVSDFMDWHRIKSQLQCDLFEPGCRIKGDLQIWRKHACYWLLFTFL